MNQIFLCLIVSACIGRVDLKTLSEIRKDVVYVSACIGRVDLKNRMMDEYNWQNGLCLYWQSGFKEVCCAACGDAGIVSACIGRVDLKVSAYTETSAALSLCLYWQSGFKEIQRTTYSNFFMSLPVLAEWI